MKLYIEKALWSCCLLVISVVAGCSNNQLPTYQVNGQLEYADGSTPMFGDIEFYNSENRVNARGKINRDGTFTLTTYKDGDGAIAGTHQVVIIQMTGNYLTAKSNSQIEHNHGSLIHSKYVDYRTSDLECTVTEGENDITLTVERNPNQTEDGMPTH